MSSSRLSSGRSKAGTWDESSLILQANANWGIDVASSAMLSVAGCDNGENWRREGKDPDAPERPS